LSPCPLLYSNKFTLGASAINFYKFLPLQTKCKKWENWNGIMSMRKFLIKPGFFPILSLK
jgi:hypothetical protein